MSRARYLGQYPGPGTKIGLTEKMRENDFKNELKRLTQFYRGFIILIVSIASPREPFGAYIMSKN